MKRNNKKMSFFTSCVLILGLIGGQSINAKAAFYTNQQASVEGYSIINILVLKETLHADGFSSSTSGRVTDLWLTTDKCWFPNNVENERAWKAYHPDGEYAKGSFNNKIGIPSPWGAVGIGTNSQYMSILF